MEGVCRVTTSRFTDNDGTMTIYAYTAGSARTGVQRVYIHTHMHTYMYTLAPAVSQCV